MTPTKQYHIRQIEIRVSTDGDYHVVFIRKYGKKLRPHYYTPPA